MTKTTRKGVFLIMVITLIMMAAMTISSHAASPTQPKLYSDRIVMDITPDEWGEVVGDIDVYLNVNNKVDSSYDTVWKKVKTVSSSTRRITIPKLDPHNAYNVQIRYKCKSIYGSTVMDGQDTLYDAQMLPVRVKGVKQDRWYYYIKQIDASWKKQQSVTGYQYEFYNWKNKRVIKKTTDSNYKNDAFFEKIKNGKTYKLRVRAYTEFNGKKYWGAWSPYTYFVGQTPKITPKFNKKKLTVSWQKVSGATSYTVMVSTNPYKGYKAVKTVSAKKKAKITVSKLGKKKFVKGKNYYVYVRSNKKVGKKTFNSNDNGEPLYYSIVRCK